MKPSLIGFSYIISSRERKAVAKPEASRITEKESVAKATELLFFFFNSFTCVCEGEGRNITFLSLFRHWTIQITRTYIFDILFFLVFFGIWTLIKKYVFPSPSYCENPWQYKQMHWLAFNSDTRLSEIIALRKCEFFHSSSFNYKYLICLSFYCWLSYQSGLSFIWLNMVHLRSPSLWKVYCAWEDGNKLKVWVIFILQGNLTIRILSGVLNFQS